MSIETLTAFSVVGIILSVVNTALIAVIYGKVFFSTHIREFLPIDKFAEVKKNLAVAAGIGDEVDDNEAELEEHRMNELRRKLWNGFAGDVELPLELDVAKPKKREP